MDSSIRKISILLLLLSSFQQTLTSTLTFDQENRPQSFKNVNNDNSSVPDIKGSYNVSRSDAELYLKGQNNMKENIDFTSSSFPALSMSSRLEKHCNKTGTNETSEYPEYLGFITAGIAVIFYGSNFVPVKKFETGDGKYCT